MVEAISNVCSNDNTNRNTGIAAGVGAVTGYLAGAKTKKIFKNGDFTDEFVKQVTNQAIDVVGKEEELSSKGIKMVKEAVGLGENPDINKVKEYLKKHAKSLEDYDGEIDDILKKSDNEIIAEFKKLTSPVTTRVNKVISKTKEYYINNNNSLKTQSKNVSKAIQLAIKAEKALRRKAGAIWGVAAGIVSGFGTYVISKVLNNKES